MINHQVGARVGEDAQRQLSRLVFGGVVIAETSRAQRVLETGHPPVYYQSVLVAAAPGTVTLRRLDGV